MERSSKGLTDFTQTGPVAPTDPVANQYAAGVAVRRAGPAKPAKYTTGVAGGPPPAIPPLDGPPPNAGMTMADMAAAQRGVGRAPMGGLFQPPAQVPGPPPGFPQPGARVMGPPPFGGGPPPQMAGHPQQPAHQQAQTRPKPAMALQQDDLLPESALRDPAFRPGANARQAVSQPELAYRHGVLRNGQFITPQVLASGRPGPSAETLESLQHIAEFNERRRAEELAAQEAEAEKKVAEGAPGAAAKLAGTTGVQDPTRPEARVDNFDLQRVREMQMEDLLNNEDQKKIVEERCEPMDLSELVFNARVTQTVPITPRVLEPTFQSLTATDELTLRRLIIHEANSTVVNDKYLMDKYSMMSLTAGLLSINHHPLPTHYDAEGKFDEDLFWKKFEMVMKMPFHLVAALAINFFWFEVRVRKLCVMQRVGNG